MASSSKSMGSFRSTIGARKRAQIRTFMVSARVDGRQKQVTTRGNDRNAAMHFMARNDVTRAFVHTPLGIFQFNRGAPILGTKLYKTSAGILVRGGPMTSVVIPQVKKSVARSAFRRRTFAKKLPSTSHHKTAAASSRSRSNLPYSAKTKARFAASRRYLADLKEIAKGIRSSFSHGSYHPSRNSKSTSSRHSSRSHSTSQSYGRY